MWFIILGLTFGAYIVGTIYLIGRIRHFLVIRKLANGRRGRSILFALLTFIIVSAALLPMLGVLNYIIVTLHLMLFWLICDGIGRLLRGKKERRKGIYIPGITAVLITFIYMTAAYIIAHCVVRTGYELTSDKLSSDKRIIMISDSHIGALFDGDKLSEYVERINEEKPDIVIICGDFVDDGTTRENMMAAITALSGLKTKSGTYYVYGNHDRGLLRNDSGYTADELENSLKDAGITVLVDDIVILDDMAIIGRQDKYFSSRKSAGELMASVPSSLYSVMLDHQPNDYDAEAASGADLVLSGHTHGGQLLPITYVGEWFNLNDRTYGHERRDNTDFIVSSGIGDWEILFKTGCKSEYVVIDVKGTASK